MAKVTIQSEGRTLSEPAEISAFLGNFGIWYRRYEGAHVPGPEATNEEILAAYQKPIDKLKEEGGYVTADVINVRPDTPNVEALLNRFSREHFHTEDEVRFIVAGRGLFHIHPRQGPVFSIEVSEGDMINVPSGTHHWFDLCQERTIRAVRLFQDMSGWTPHYTETGEESLHQPLCFSQPVFSAPQG